MTEIKKVWEEPVIMILVRSKSEEAVLDSCKVHLTSTSPNDDDTNCYKVNIGCGPCTQIAAS